MAVAGLVVLGLGVGLVVLGTAMSVRDWNRKHQPAPVPEGQFETEPQALPETLEGLAKVFDAIRGYESGMQLVLVGVLLIVIGGVIGGLSGL